MALEHWRVTLTRRTLEGAEHVETLDLATQIDAYRLRDFASLLSDVVAATAERLDTPQPELA
jgi:hypothetical protein